MTLYLSSVSLFLLGLVLSFVIWDKTRERVREIEIALNRIFHIYCIYIYIYVMAHNRFKAR